jgi:pimeloyl-ACP methyl ester carboxylesterase
MVAPLAARGLDTVAVDLPSCDTSGGRRAGLHADAEAVVAAVDAIVGGGRGDGGGPAARGGAIARPGLAEVGTTPRPRAEGSGDGGLGGGGRGDGRVVLVGHSYGGAVITEAGIHDAVAHLVYLTAVVPDVGESLAALSGREPAPWMDPGDDGTVGVHVEGLVERFLPHADASTAAEAVRRLTRQAEAAFTEAPRRAAWRTTPSTFVVCAGDLAVPVEHQRANAARLAGGPDRSRPGAGRSAGPGTRTRTVEIATDHFPFVTAPDVLAAAIADALAVP